MAKCNADGDRQNADAALDAPVPIPTPAKNWTAQSNGRHYLVRHDEFTRFDTGDPGIGVALPAIPGRPAKPRNLQDFASAERADMG